MVGIGWTALNVVSTILECGFAARADNPVVYELLKLGVPAISPLSSSRLLKRLPSWIGAPSSRAVCPCRVRFRERLMTTQATPLPTRLASAYLLMNLSMPTRMAIDWIGISARSKASRPE